VAQRYASAIVVDEGSVEELAFELNR